MLRSHESKWTTTTTTTTTKTKQKTHYKKIYFFHFWVHYLHCYLCRTQFSDSFLTTNKETKQDIFNLDLRKERNPGKNNRLGCGRAAGVRNSEGPWMTSTGAGGVSTSLSMLLLLLFSGAEDEKKWFVVFVVVVVVVVSIFVANGVILLEETILLELRRIIIILGQFLG